MSLPRRIAGKAYRSVKKIFDQKVLNEQVEAHRERLKQPQYFDPAPKNILFLCYGNICRSPFAEFYWNKKLSSAGLETPRAFSAGLNAGEGNRSPEVIIEVTRQFDIDLTPHRSKLATRDLIAKADVIFVMDLLNWRQFKKLFPSALDKTYLLGLFSPEDDPVIKDPYMMDREAAIPVYHQLIRSLDGLFEVVTKSK